MALLSCSVTGPLFISVHEIPFRVHCMPGIVLGTRGRVGNKSLSQAGDLAKWMTITSCVCSMLWGTEMGAMVLTELCHQWSLYIVSCYCPLL